MEKMCANTDAVNSLFADFEIDAQKEKMEDLKHLV